MTKRGLFVTLEGIEGSGKSTQTQMLVQHLKEHYDIHVVQLREPGTTVIGDKIRDVLLAREHSAMSQETELLLYVAARSQLISEEVVPALERGNAVFLDRFIDSSVAYQGYGRGIDLGQIYSLNRFATRKIYPDVTLLFDLPVKVGLRRAAQTGKPDRIEAESLEFHERVRRGYLEIAKQEPERFVVIDATQDPVTIHEQVKQAVLERLEKMKGGPNELR